VQKLTGYAVRPLARLKASQKRRDRLRDEIKQQNVKSVDGLWDGDDFTLVAETKVRTLELRNKTIELLMKEATLAEDFRRTMCHPCQDDYSAEPSCDLAQSIDTSFADHSPSIDTRFECSVETFEDARPEDNEVMQNLRRKRANLRRNMMQNSEEADICVPTSGRTSKQEVMNKSDETTSFPSISTRTAKIEPGISNSKAKSTSRSPSSSGSMYPSRGIPDSGNKSPRSPTLKRFVRPSIVIEDTKAGTSPSPMSGRPSSTMATHATKHPGRRSSSPRKDMQNLKDPAEHNSPALVTPSQQASRRISASSGGSQVMATPRKTLSFISPAEASKQKTVGSELGKHSGLAGSLRSWMEQQVLFEDKRNIVLEAPDGSEDIHRCSMPAHIRVMENKGTGGIRLEVCFNTTLWTSSQVVERSLPLHEVTQFFDWGNKSQESAGTRYKWASDIVRLRALDDIKLPLRELPVGEKECSRFKILLTSYDIPDAAQEKTKLGLAFLRTGVEGIFHESQIQVLNEIAFITSIDSEPSQEEMDAKRKDAEIKNMRKRHTMYDSTCEALYDWYTRLHHSGCGFLDEKEFASFWRAVVSSYGLNLDDAQVRRHWHEMSTCTECTSGFTQFVNYLVHRFPHVKTMTAYQVRRFQERSKSIRHEPEPVQEEKAENAEAKERRREEDKEEKEEDKEEGDESEAEEDEEEVESKSVTTEDSSSRRPKLAQYQNSGSLEKTRPQRPKLAQHHNSVSLGKMRLQRPKLSQHHNSISLEKTRRFRKAGESQEL
jgi:hypothetical protein